MDETPVDPAAEALAQEFDARRKEYDLFAEKVFVLTNDLLRASRIRPSAVSFRVKERESFLRKISWRTKKYSSLGAVTDLVGLRIVTYFVDEIDRVADLIESEFVVDRSNSVDKRKLEDPDRFGYQSLHFIVSLNDSRKRLSEWACFGAMKAEIQIRSLLQHAWAEIEHDRGYKGDLCPVEFKRRFSRLAGLLEVADDEFRGLRNDLEEYSAAIRNKSSYELARLRVDSVTVNAFVWSSPHLRAFEEMLAETFGGWRRSDPRPFGTWPDASDMDWFRKARFRTIGDIDRALQEQAGRLFEYLRPIASGLALYPGVCLRYLALIVVARRVTAPDFETLIREQPNYEPEPDLSEKCRSFHDLANGPDPDVQIVGYSKSRLARLSKAATDA